MVSQLSAASILAMALCFGDDGFAEEIRKIYMIGWLRW